MIVHNIRLLETFAQQHADARKPLLAWLRETRDATWRTPADIKARFTSASFLSDNRVVLNIKGNRYRLLLRVTYESGRVRVLKIGTHGDYDQWRLEP